MQCVDVVTATQQFAFGRAVPRLGVLVRDMQDKTFVSGQPTFEVGAVFRARGIPTLSATRSDGSL